MREYPALASKIGYVVPRSDSQEISLSVFKNCKLIRLFTLLEVVLVVVFELVELASVELLLVELVVLLEVLLLVEFVPGIQSLDKTDFKLIFT